MLSDSVFDDTVLKSLEDKTFTMVDDVFLFVSFFVAETMVPSRFSASSSISKLISMISAFEMMTFLEIVL